MPIIKCKMCGGDIQFNSEQKTYGTCESCGSTMTLPSINDERITNLFNRANYFRRIHDFDKAVNAYDTILNEDSSNAEAHWGVVLSRYGIEYVEDPTSHKMVPTCHRVQFSSILSDPDYLLALENAPDTYSKNLYEEEAKKISDIQKGILDISNKEEPYDVFICYKESTDSGTRTQDSVLAQDIYFQLIEQGYKVFYSKITLESKLGEQYEPYIFAALNSAKVMLVIGTKAEYFNLVWVKNEWSRYLSLMKTDKNRLLIPCYRDMDAYDLPEELSLLQSQDMSKIGFIQDLVRGINKVLENDSKDEPTTSGAMSVTAVTNIAPLLERAFLCLEDKDFEKADSLLEQVLNSDPKCAKAYVGKLMCEMEVSSESDLLYSEYSLYDSGNYQKAVRYANDKYKNIIEGYNQTNICERIYRSAIQAAQENTITSLESAIVTFDSISSYQDSTEQSTNCKIQIEKIRDEEERQKEIDRINAEKESKRYKIILLASLLISSIVLIICILFNYVFLTSIK